MTEIIPNGSGQEFREDVNDELTKLEINAIDLVLPLTDGTNRPSNPVNGLEIFNTSTLKREIYYNGTWH